MTNSGDLFTRDFVEQTINSFFRRGEAARAAGGISMKEVVEGTKVPEGWRLDPQIDYFLPPNVSLL